MCRKLEHSTVAMISDAPELLDALLRFNKSVLGEAAQKHGLSDEEVEKRQTALEEARKSIPGLNHYTERYKRLWKTLGIADDL